MLRTLDDSLALRRRLADRPRVVVIGAGFIGLEVAATAAQSGCAVTVLEGATGAVDARPRRRDGRGRRQGARPQRRRRALRRAGRRRSRATAGGSPACASATASSCPPTWSSSASASSPATDWLDGSGLELRDGIVCDDVAACRARDLRRRRLRPMGQQPVRRIRRRDACRALDERRRAGMPRRRRTCWPSWPAKHRRRMRRCRSSGATSSTAASSSSAGPTATTRCRSSPGDLDGKFVALYGHGGRLRGVLGREHAQTGDADAKADRRAGLVGRRCDLCRRSRSIKPEW